jgi:putative hydrolase of the HAD superfamily
MNNSAFFFDLDNTLFDYEASFKKASLFAYTSIFASKFIHPISSEEWFQSYKKYCDMYWPDYENNLLTKEQYRRNRLESSFSSLNISISINDFQMKQFQLLVEENIPSSIKPFPWISKILNLVSHSGNELGVISNGSSKLQREKLRKLGLRFLDENIYISSELSFAKPSPEIFEYVACRGRSRQYIYCGDSFEFDIKPAVQAGWKGIWWNPEYRFFPVIEQGIEVCHSENDLLTSIKKYIE